MRRGWDIAITNYEDLFFHSLVGLGSTVAEQVAGWHGGCLGKITIKSVNPARTDGMTLLG